MNNFWLIKLIKIGVLHACNNGVLSLFEQAYENEVMDERTESRPPRDDRYADRHGERNGRGGRHNRAMDNDDDDYHSRDGSPTMGHTNHMGVDPVHGSIGTGV